jgi:hypothetical protein
MKMTNNLPMYEEVFQGSPGLGHMPRRMTAQDSTDGGIVNRIQMAIQQGMISQEAGKYLIENLLDDDQTTRQALRGMPSPRNMPPMDQVEPYSMMRGLLGD